jgi:hypothetical protein
MLGWVECDSAGVGRTDRQPQRSELCGATNDRVETRGELAGTGMCPATERRRLPGVVGNTREVQRF